MTKIVKVSIVSAFSLSLFLFAQAQESSFNFPIKELGNCGSKQECKNYCAQAENFEVCAAFAESHNLMPKGAKQKQAKLDEAIKTKGPGGCDSRKTCETYCAGEEHQAECLEFAKSHGLISQEEQAKVDKFLPLMKQGLTPGACKSKQACEVYCHQAEHQTECLDFAVKVGAMKPEDAARFKKLNGQGPGGCQGKDECESFCNDEAHQEACINFAKEHGMMQAGEEDDIKQGAARMRLGLKNAPPEVQACLKSSQDAGMLEQIEQGEFTPTPEIGQQVKECFEQFKPKVEERMRHNFQADPKTEECIKAAVGEEAFNKIKSGDAPSSLEMGKKMRQCFDQQGQREEQQNEDQTQQGGPEESNNNATNSQQMQQQMADCMGKMLGPEAADKIKNHTLDTSVKEVKAAVEACKQQFQKSRSGNPGQDGRQQKQDFGAPQSNSQDIKKCIQGKLGEEGMKKMSDPAQRNTPEMQATLKDCGYNLRPQAEGDRGPNMKPEQPSKNPPLPPSRQNQEQSGRPPADNQMGSGYQPRTEEGQRSGDYYNQQQNYQPPPPREGSSQYQSAGGNFQPPPSNNQPPPPPSGEVKGASTSRLPWFLRWILGR